MEPILEQKSEKKKKPPSFQDSWCGHCGEKVQCRYMTKHNSRKHKGAELKFVEQRKAEAIRKAWSESQPLKLGRQKKTRDLKRAYPDPSHGQGEDLWTKTAKKAPDGTLTEKTGGDVPARHANQSSSFVQTAHKSPSVPSTSVCTKSRISTTKSSDKDVSVLFKKDQANSLRNEFGDNQIKGNQREKQALQDCHPTIPGHCENLQSEATAEKPKESGNYRTIKTADGVVEMIESEALVRKNEELRNQRVERYRTYLPKQSQAWNLHPNAFVCIGNEALEGTQLYFRYRAAATHLPEICELLSKCRTNQDATDNETRTPKEHDEVFTERSSQPPLDTSDAHSHPQSPKMYEKNVRADCDEIEDQHGQSVSVPNDEGVIDLMEYDEPDLMPSSSPVENNERICQVADPQNENFRKPTKLVSAVAEDHSDSSSTHEGLTVPDLNTGFTAIPTIEKETYAKRVNQARSLQSLLHLSEYFEYDSVSQTVFCKPCTSKYGNRRGRLNFDASTGCDFTNESQSEDFMKLKRKIISHVSESKTHRQALGITVIEPSKEMSEQEYEAGMNVGTAAYNCVKLNTGYKKFQEFLRSSAARGQQIGDINHCEKLAAALNSQYFLLWKEHMRREFAKPHVATGKPPFFSAVADKCTPNSDSLHVVGIIFPYKNEMQPYFLGLVENQCGTGKGLAREIYGVLLDYFSADDIRMRLVGASWDGQYVKNRVHEHLLQLTGHPCSEFPSFTWDLSHCLELAGKDSRKLMPKSKLEQPFICETFNTMREVGSKLGRGKGWKDLKQMAVENSQLDFGQLQHYEDEKELRMRRPMAHKPFCKTRFSTYLSEVINSNRVNYPLAYKLLDKYEDPAFKSIADAKYVLRMNGLYDFYSEVGKLSRTMQRPNTFTWNVEEAIDRAFVNFSNMKEEFMETKSPLATRRFHNAVQELMESGCHKRCPIPSQRMRIFLTKKDDESERGSVVNLDFQDEIKVVRNELASHVEDFEKNLRTRLNQTQPEVLKWTRNIFALKEVMNRSEDCNPRWLSNMFQLCQKAGICDNNLTLDQFTEEYKEFCTNVRSRYSLLKDGNHVASDSDQTIYMDMLREPSLQPNVMNMLASSISRTYCEAITEGMGSTVDIRLGGRESLSNRTLFQEAFMAWNGPSVGKKSQKLIEAGLNRYFSGGPWHFCRRSDKRHLQNYEVSKVVDRLESSADRMDPPEFY